MKNIFLWHTKGAFNFNTSRLFKMEFLWIPTFWPIGTLFFFLLYPVDLRCWFCPALQQGNGPNSHSRSWGQVPTRQPGGPSTAAAPAGRCRMRACSSSAPDKQHNGYTWLKLFKTEQEHQLLQAVSEWLWQGVSCCAKCWVQKGSLRFIEIVWICGLSWGCCFGVTEGRWCAHRDSVLIGAK